MGLLHTFKSFTAPALGPCVLNVCMIVSISVAYWLTPNPVFGLALGVLLGGILQFAIQIPSILRQGFHPRLLKARPDFFHPGITRIARLLVPRVFGTAVYQLNVLVDTVLASLSFIVGQGAVAAIYFVLTFITNRGLNALERRIRIPT